eukprot:5440345-Pleurochrysis_carterae.AAC.2
MNSGRGRQVEKGWQRQRRSSTLAAVRGCFETGREGEKERLFLRNSSATRIIFAQVRDTKGECTTLRTYTYHLLDVLKQEGAARQQVIQSRRSTAWTQERNGRADSL